MGVDAADWLALDPLIAQGRLPHFARLRQSGRTGVMMAEPPLLSPILWTTIATGRPPEEHGVLDFMVDTPGGGQAPVGSSSRRVPALWNAFAEAGRNVAVVGWWATWPAETLHGCVVSDRVAPQLLRADPAALDAHAIAPPSARERLLPLLVRPDSVTDADLRARLPATDAELAAARAGLTSPGRFYADPLAHLAAIVAGTRSYTAVAEELLRRERPAFLAIYLEAIDSVSHRFVGDPRGRTAIASAYADVDESLARLSRAADPSTWVVVVSDHGFWPATAGIVEDPADLAGPASAWHRPEGIAAAIEARDLSSDKAVFPGSRVETIGPLDVAPTLLHAAGLAVGDRMTGRVASELLPPEASSRPLARAPFPERGPTLPDAAMVADPEALARLRALGYVGAVSTSLARQNLGEILYRRGRLDAAERELRAVVEVQPANLAAWLWLARACADQGRRDEALRAYRAALHLPGAARDALVPAVELALATEGVPGARALVDGLSPGERSTGPAFVARSLVLRRSGQAQAADRMLRAALAQDPLNLDALERLLDVSPARDLALFERAAAAAPESPRHAAFYGAALLAARRTADAQVPLAHALALAPGGDSVRVLLARAQLGQGDPEAALATLAVARPAADVATLRGAALTRRERWPEAAKAYAEALELAPTPTPELLNALAWAELQQGRGSEARALLDRSLALRPGQPEIRALRERAEAGS